MWLGYGATGYIAWGAAGLRQAHRDGTERLNLGALNTRWLPRLVRLEQSLVQVETDPVTNLKFVHQSISPSVHRSIGPSVHRSIGPSVHQSRYRLR